VPISAWCGGGIHSTERPLVSFLVLQMIDISRTSSRSGVETMAVSS